MENRKLPALLAMVAIVIAVVVFFAFGDDDTSEDATDTPEPAQTSTQAPSGKGDGQEKPEPEKSEVLQLEIKGGEPVGGVQEIEVSEGERVHVADVTTDAADELHLHGYDLYYDVVPGQTKEIVLPVADIEGVFELESHSTGAVLAEISVVPD